MTTYSQDFTDGVTEALKYGQQLRIKYYDVGFGAGSYYDDDVTLTQSGVNYWASGVVLPVTNKQGSDDALLLEQGKIIKDDTKLYIHGYIDTSGTIKVGLGSYTNMSGCEYSIIEGITKYDVNAVGVLKKLFIRKLTNGSFIGE